ncbi:hypothetical protein BpHYR1_032275 [Brachionus plicatilis]|uniref:Uncharacterized protein n=1 Tax=Brachionus plicatilis TaxID=10195 RepID=A0A3M7Q6T0_BRAPC|nr:hypothetical protein BpHYR1_032275 [Brachionus plicatilis]
MKIVLLPTWLFSGYSFTDQLLKLVHL